MKYNTSEKLLGETKVADIVEERRVRNLSLRREFIESGMKSAAGRAFFQALIYGYSIGEVGHVGLLDANPKLDAGREGIRAMQSSLNAEVRRCSRPSDYNAMLMQALGGEVGNTNQEE